MMLSWGVDGLFKPEFDTTGRKTHCPLRVRAGDLPLIYTLRWSAKKP